MLLQNGMNTIWIGGSDFQKEGVFVWDNDNRTLIKSGYSNWNPGQVILVENTYLIELKRIGLKVVSTLEFGLV